MLRLIHTADWRLGKPYGRFDSDVRAALSEARFDAIDAIGKAAAEHDVAHVLVAGDVFDTEGPEDRVIVQAVSRMQRYACTRLDLMTEILTEAATRMQDILLTCRDRAFRHLGNRISLTGGR